MQCVSIAAIAREVPATYASVMFCKAASLRPKPESAESHNGLRDDFLGQSEQHSGCLGQSSAGETYRVLEVRGDAVKLRPGRL
jgi:hypothetical protein